MNSLEMGNNGQVARVPDSVIQHGLENISLTASEIGHLWATYLAESILHVCCRIS
jgi:hypothetical protein